MTHRLPLNPRTNYQKCPVTPFVLISTLFFSTMATVAEINLTTQFLNANSKMIEVVLPTHLLFIVSCSWLGAMPVYLIEYWSLRLLIGARLSIMRQIAINLLRLLTDSLNLQKQNHKKAQTSIFGLFQHLAINPSTLSFFYIQNHLHHTSKTTSSFQASKTPSTTTISIPISQMQINHHPPTPHHHHHPTSSKKAKFSRFVLSKSIWNF